MTETKEPSKKLSLTTPRRLEAKKAVETGQVRQSFSHGRSKAVTVEVRKKRSVRRDTAQAREKEVAVEADKAAAPLEVATAPAEELASQSRARPMLRSLTNDERQQRVKVLEEARYAEGERRRAEEETRKLAEEDARIRREAEEAEQRKTDEEERRRKEDEARRQSEEAADRRLAERQSEAAETAEARPGAPTDARGRRKLEEDAESRERGRSRRRPEVKRPSPGRQQQRRRSGRVNLDRALSDDERVRSLASVRRQREKLYGKHKSDEPPAKVFRDVVVPETIQVQELANRMTERGVDIVRSLMKMGMMVTVNQSIDADTAELVVQEYGHRVKRVSAADVEIGLKGESDDEGMLQPRPPVVTIMGHVDHGKTSLLDALRETDVVAGEVGGITQHIGAYTVTLSSGAKITFLDTPGHEAFTAMRARGAKATDIVVLVVAADDGVMPQTVEAINHAKAAKVPIIIAINKIDRPDANPDRVRQLLLDHEIVVESMGGDVLCVELSALEKLNLDKLEEAILLQAEILDLQANPDRSAEGVVVEARMESGRGSIATLLLQRGTLAVGEIVVAGREWGKVRALLDERGQRFEVAGPSMPVEVLGLNGAPEAGEEFVVVETEARAREVTDFRRRLERDTRATATSRGTLEQMFIKIQAGESNDLPLVIKADVQGSVEAIAGALSKLNTDEVAVRVLHMGVGGINESDVTLANASDALIIGFNVRADIRAREMARRDQVDIRYYSIIYNVVEDVKNVLSGMLEPTFEENFLGNAEIREVFSISKVGRVAGCRVTEGIVRRGARVRLLRDNVVIHEGSLGQLKRFKDDVREVREGYECGMAFENYQDIQVSDVIEAFELKEVERTL